MVELSRPGGGSNAEIARAKINLALHVRGRMADGYHRLETIFAFAEFGDRLEAQSSTDIELELRGPFAGDLDAGPDNLVRKAAELLRTHSGTLAGVKLILDKRLPVAAGLGGGSADAAAALRLLVRWWKLEVEAGALARIAADLGADVPACLDGRPTRGEGRGDALSPFPSEGLTGKPVLLVNPGVALTTSEVFARWDGIDRGPLGDWRAGRNDLTLPAIQCVPMIETVLDSLGRAEIARMSGSGASCFGLYATIADRDADAMDIGNARPGWWTAVSRLA